MDSIPRYIAGKIDPSSVHYETEKLRPILDVTYGCMVYQEQVMQIVRDLAGYSYGRSDLVRRAMAKKKHKIMEEERQYFVHGMTDKEGHVVIPGCVRNGVPENVANHIYDEMISFASYAFNKSHAAAYAVVAVQTGWLKRHYPVPFMAAIINSVYGNSGKIAGYIQYCRSKGIPVLGPDINHSGWKFSVQKQPDGSLAILFGLGAVKTVGHNAVDAIVRERQNGPFRDLFDFGNRIDTSECGKRMTEYLIRVGSFDYTGAYRSQMLAVFDLVLEANAARRKSNVSGQLSLFDLATPDDTPLIENPELPRLPDLTLRQRLAMEKECSGVYISGHPLDDYRDLLATFEFSTLNLSNLEEREDHGMLLDGQYVHMAGILTEVKGKATKKGAYMGFVTLEDLTRQIECLVFPKVYEKYQADLTADDLVVLSGRLSVREEESPKLLVDQVVPLDQWDPQKARSPQQRGPRPLENRTPQATPDAPAPQEPKVHRQPAAPQLTDAQLAARSARKLYLRLERPQLSRASDLLGLYPGSVPVYLHIPSEKITLLAEKLRWCDAGDACIKRLSDTFGAENVKLVVK